MSELGDAEGAREKAKEGLRKAKAFLQLKPDEYRARNMGAFALYVLGEVDEAISWMEESMRYSPRNSVLAYNAASFYAMTGDTDKSLDCLSQAAETGCLNLDWLAKDAGMERLRGEPRFQALVHQFRNRRACETANPLCL